MKSVEPFFIQIGKDISDDVNHRLDHICWPYKIKDSGWERGTDTEYLRSLVNYWRNQYNWWENEDELNRFAHFKSKVNGINIHFIHEKGKGNNPMPIILTHGWPDSFIRYRKIIPMLSDPVKYGADAEDSFDLIVPSCLVSAFPTNLHRAV